MDHAGGDEIVGVEYFRIVDIHSPVCSDRNRQILTFDGGDFHAVLKFRAVNNAAMDVMIFLCIERSLSRVVVQFTLIRGSS